MTTFELDLEPDRANVSKARKFATDRARDLGLDDEVDVVELLVSEAVTNAVLHAGTELTVKLIWSEDRVLRVEVTDGSPMGAVKREYGAEAATGRGIGLIEALAADWGTRAEPRGKTVWFTVRAQQHAVAEPAGDD